MEKTGSILNAVGGAMVLVGAVLHMAYPIGATWIYCAGTLLFSVTLFADRYVGDNVTVKRLRGQQVLGAVFLLISAALMMSEPFRPSILSNTDMNGRLHTILVALTERNNWIVFMCIAAAYELFASIRLERVSGNADS